MNFENSLILRNQVEKKENLYEKVEMKIQTILDFRKLAENNINQSPDEFAGSLNSGLEDVKKKLGAEKIAQYELLQEKRLKKFELDERVYELLSILYPDSESDDDDSEIKTLSADEIAAEKEAHAEYEILDEEANNLHNEIRKMEEDDDLVFISELETFTQSMLQKKKRTLKLLERIGEKEENISDVIFSGYEFKEAPKILSAGICINIILSPEDYKAIRGGNSSGTHLHGQPINIIKDTFGKESTIRHEENHNISESFAPNVMYIDSFIKGLESKVVRIGNDIYPDFYIEDMKQRVEREIASYYKWNYHEILADIDRLPEGDMSTFLYNYSRAERKIRLFADGIEDKEFSKRLHQKIDEMETNFLTYFNNLSNIFYAANKMGKTEETKALMVLFGNGKGIRKIERQLRHYDPSYDNLVLLRRFTGELDYTKDNSSAVLNDILGISFNKPSKVSSRLGISFSDLEGLSQIETLSESMTDPGQRRAVANRMREMNEISFGGSEEYDFTNKSIDDYMQAIDILNKIGKNCEVRNRVKFIKSYKRNLFRHYLKNVLDKKDLSEIRARYAKDFKKFFGAENMNEALKTEIEFEFQKYCNKSGQIKNKDLRAFLEENGMETKYVDVLKGANSYFKKIMGNNSLDWKF
ncbi:MAG: hypothetical protein ACWGHO_02390 [Candidatus Moraniibacteriota bacterium]